MIRLSRLTFRAALLSAVIFAGYALGTAAVFYRIHAQSAFQVETYAAARRGETLSVPEYMNVLWMGRFTAEDVNAPITPGTRYPNGVAHYSFGRDCDYALLLNLSAETFILLFGVVCAGYLGSQRAPLGMSPGGLMHAPASARRQIRRHWVDALGKAPSNWAMILPAGAIVGFSAAIMGESAAIIFDYCWGERAWTRSGTTSIMYLRPFFALLAWPDAIWLLACSFLLAAGSVVLGSRIRISNDPAISARWCFACGYPRAVPANGDEPSATSVPALCSECGKSQSTLRQRFRPIHFKLLMAATLILSVMAYFAVPRITMSL